MRTRKIIISISGVVILTAGIFLSGRLAKNGGDKAQQKKEVPKTAVRLMNVENKPIKSHIPITGRVVPKERIDLFAEVSGVAYYGARPFKTGMPFAKGEALLRIDAAEFKRSVTSRKSQYMSLLAQVIPDLKIDFPSIYDSWKEYLINLDIEKPLPPLPTVETEQQKLFLTGRDVYANYYSLKEAEERLKKYTILAPFNGILTESSINQGALVRTGQQLGEFIMAREFELEASVNYNDLQFLKPGMEVSLNNVNAGNSFAARITRINNKVDPNTQLVKVFLSIVNEDLRSGIYLEGKVLRETIPKAIRVPREALVDDSSVFLAKDGIAQLQKVEVHNQSQNEAIISGVADGSKVIIDEKTKAFDGAPVTEALN